MPIIQWSFDLGGPGTTSAPVIGDDGTIYIVGEYPGTPVGGGVRNSGVMAITPQGTLEWFFPAPIDIGTALYSLYPESVTLGLDQTIYFGGRDSTLYALNRNGTVKWKKTGFAHRYNSTGGAGFPAVSPPVIDNQGLIYTGTDTIFCFRPDGSIVWRFKNDTLGFCNRIALGKKLIFCALLDRGILALDYQGNQKWFHAVDLTNLPHYGMIVDENDNVYFKANSNVLRKLDHKGQVIWTAGGGALSEPVLRGEYLYFGTFGVVLRIDKYTGEEDSLLDAYPVYYDSDTGPLIDDNGTVFIGSRAGRTADPPGQSDFALLTAVTWDGSVLWRLDLEGSVRGSSRGRIALGHDGTLYVTTCADGIPDGNYKLFAIR
jgi:outer membrane protein assembly factor BamB